MSGVSPTVQTAQQLLDRIGDEKYTTPDADIMADIVASIGSIGGGGSLPAWWTVDSTPGAESVDFAGVVTISPTDDTLDGLVRITSPVGYEANTPGNGPILELWNGDQGVAIHQFDVNGQYRNVIPTAQVGGAHGFHVLNEGGGDILQLVSGSQCSRLALSKTDGSPWHALDLDIGFFAATPVPQQTLGPTPTGAEIRALLVAYGLCAA